MATVSTDVDSTTYVQVIVGTDGIIQNSGNVDLLLIFAGSLPDVNDTNYHTLQAKSNQALQVIGGVPSGNAYVRAVGNRDNTGGKTLQNYQGKVSVST